MPQPVIVAGARTPIGKLLGALAPLSAPQLAGAAIAAALERAGISGDQVDAVTFGNVIQAGVGPNPARLGAAAGGIPMRVPAVTVNSQRTGTSPRDRLPSCPTGRARSWS
jgi:acetyl-CoA C-acetyltransferase